MKKRKPTREEIRRYIEQSREMLEGDIPEDEEMADLFNKMSRDSMENAKTDESEQGTGIDVIAENISYSEGNCNKRKQLSDSEKELARKAFEKFKSSPMEFPLRLGIHVDHFPKREKKQD